LLRIPYKTRLSLFATFFLLALVAFLLSCREKPAKQTFQEVNGFDSPLKQQEIQLPAVGASEPTPDAIEAPAGQDAAPQGTASATGKLQWSLPTGWNAHVGTGMFYAVVKTSATPDANEAGIVMLAGEAGGLQANVERWLGQLGLNLPAPQVEAFLAEKKTFRSAGNLEVTFLDFTSVIAEEESQCMLIGIVKPGPDSYFIKLKGTKAGLTKDRSDFVKFCESLRFE
jgi:hypothetical protein